MDNRIRAQEWQRLAEMDLSSAEYLLNKGYAAGAEQRKSNSRFCSKSCSGDGAGRTEAERITIAGQPFIITK